MHNSHKISENDGEISKVSDISKEFRELNQEISMFGKNLNTGESNNVSVLSMSKS